MTEIAWLIDHDRADMVHELFTGEAEMNLPGITLRGPDEIRAWGEQRALSGRVTRHVCTNMRFAASGPESAAGTTIATVYAVTAVDSPVSPAGLYEYQDAFVRAQGRWKFHARNSLILLRPS